MELTKEERRGKHIRTLLPPAEAKTSWKRESIRLKQMAYKGRFPSCKRLVTLYSRRFFPGTKFPTTGSVPIPPALAADACAGPAALSAIATLLVATTSVPVELVLNQLLPRQLPPSNHPRQKFLHPTFLLSASSEHASHASPRLRIHPAIAFFLVRTPHRGTGRLAFFPYCT
jgi:hypothetical protein